MVVGQREVKLALLQVKFVPVRYLHHRDSRMCVVSIMLGQILVASFRVIAMSGVALICTHMYP
jgi:hypothetical protein